MQLLYSLKGWSLQCPSRVEVQGVSSHGRDAELGTLGSGAISTTYVRNSLRMLPALVQPARKK